MRLVIGLLLGVLVAATGCGSDDEPGSDPPGGTGSGGAGGTASGPSRDEVLASCTQFASELCESASECCAMTAPDSTVDTCVQEMVSQVCRPGADAVAAGLATYHPEAESDCLAAHALSHQTCVADWKELLELRRGIWSSCKVIRGTLMPGRGCTTPVTCAPPEGIGTARCVAGTCRVVEILSEGAECPYPNGEVSVCDAGLYCTSTERDVIGSCQPVTPTGEACDPVELNPECGLGSYCDLDEGICKVAENFGGPSCTQGTECVSFVCDDVTGECEEALPTVAALCPAE
jgi:hypothetical protein